MYLRLSAEEYLKKFPPPKNREETWRNLWEFATAVKKLSPQHFDGFYLGIEETPDNKAGMADRIELFKKLGYC